MRILLTITLLGALSCTAADGFDTHANPVQTKQGFKPAVPDNQLPGLEQTGSVPAAYTKALNEAEPGYKPRTHHLNDDGSPKFINRLIFQESPYLRQHAHRSGSGNSDSPLSGFSAR